MPLDEADKNAIKEMIGAAFKPETIGAAVKSHIDGLKLGETIAAEVAKLAPKKDDENADAGKGKGKDDPAAARLAALEKALTDEKAARAAAEEKGKVDRLHNAAREALTTAGIPADRVRAAMAVLKEDGVLTFDAEGNPGWKGKDQFGSDAVLPLADAAAKWASKEGAIFAPPSGVNGTGANGGRDNGGGGASNRITKASEIKIDLGAALANM